MGDKDLNSVLQQLIAILEKTAKEKTSTDPVLKRSMEGAKTSDDLKKSLEDQKKSLEEINKKSDNLEKNYKNIADYNKIIKGIEEEKETLLESQYRTNLEILTQLIEELRIKKELGKLSEEDEKDLNEKIKALKTATDEQAKQLKNLENEKKAKEQILVIGKEIFNNIKDQEAAMVELNKLTGGFNSEISEASKNIAVNTLATGVTIEQGRAALTNLAGQMNNLRAYGVEAASTMGTTAAYMEKVGISGATAGKSFDTLINAMGKTPLQASKIQESFVQMAAKNKMALNSITEAFANNSSRFVGYGHEMSKVLEGLGEQALKTGIKIDQLISIAQGFDTFEDAATKAGTLNALLGDQFNAIELLTASDEERIKLLQDGVRASGMQWESMNRFQKMAVANAAGIKDLNEAAKLFGKTTEENARLEQDSAAVKKTLQEQALESSVAIDKLKSTLNGLLVIIQPITTVLMILVNALAKFVKGLHELLGGGDAGALAISAIALAIWKGSSIIGKGFSFIIDKIRGFGKVLKETAADAPSAAESSNLKQSAKNIGESISSFFSGLSKNIGRVLLGIFVAGLVAIAIVALVKGFKLFEDLDAGKIIVGLGLLTVVFAAIMGLGALLSSGVGTALFTAGIIGFIALAAALGIMGLALLAVASGLQGVANAFKDLSSVAVNFAQMSKDIGSFVLDIAKIDTDGINDFADSILKLAESIKQLNSSVSAMSAMKDFEAKITSMLSFESMPPPVTPTVAGQDTSVSGVSQVDLTTGVNTGSNSKAAVAPIIPQTTFVPLVVKIEEKTILQILEPKIQRIARNESAGLISALGLVQDADIANAIVQDQSQ